MYRSTDGLMFQLIGLSFFWFSDQLVGLLDDECIAACHRQMLKFRLVLFSPLTPVDAYVRACCVGSVGGVLKTFVVSSFTLCSVCVCVCFCPTVGSLVLYRLTDRSEVVVVIALWAIYRIK